MAAGPASARVVSGGLSADGREVRLTVDAGDGVSRVLRFGHAAFEQALRHMTALMVQGRIFRDPETVHAVEAEAFRVSPLPEANKLLMTFASDADMLFHFTLPAADGAELRRELLAAERHCRRSPPQKP